MTDEQRLAQAEERAEAAEEALNDLRICEICDRLTGQEVPETLICVHCWNKAWERISKLEAALEAVLPMAKGYATEHPVGSNRQICREVEEALANPESVRRVGMSESTALQDGWTWCPFCQCYHTSKSCYHPGAQELRRLRTERDHLRAQRDRAVELLRDVRDVMQAAIDAGDWVVDGACDPDTFFYRIESLIERLEQE